MCSNLVTQIVTPEMEKLDDPAVWRRLGVLVTMDSKDSPGISYY